MKNISFDLDGTIIPFDNEFITEKRSKIARLFGVEKIRKGTNKLISELQSEGYIIHIYTTSFRPKRKIRRTLKYYGIRVEKIINQTKNKKTLKNLNVYASKYPSAFGFDIHIDDLKGVKIESEKYSFKVIIIKPNDENWVETIKHQLKKFSL